MDLNRWLKRAEVTQREVAKSISDGRYVAAVRASFVQAHADIEPLRAELAAADIDHAGLRARIGAIALAAGSNAAAVVALGELAPVLAKAEERRERALAVLAAAEVGRGSLEAMAARIAGACRGLETASAAAQGDALRTLVGRVTLRAGEVICSLYQPEGFVSTRQKVVPAGCIDEPGWLRLPGLARGDPLAVAW